MKLERSILFTSIFWFCALPPALAQQGITVIKGGTLIDGTGRAPVENVTIVIEGNRIRSIARGQATSPAGATVIDAQGKHILPGLFDGHLHYKDWMAELLISHGVTSVLSYGGGPWLNAQQEGIAKGKILGPRFFPSQGTIGDAYMGTYNPVKGEEDAIERVRRLVDLGARIIKVYTTVTPEILRVVAREADKYGLYVSGHLGISAEAAALAGIDNLAHSTGLAIDLLTPEDLKKVPTWRAIDTGRLRVVYPKGTAEEIIKYPLFLEDPRRMMMFGLMDKRLAEEEIRILVERNVRIESSMTYWARHWNDHVEEWKKEDHLLLNDPNLHYIPQRMRQNVLDYSIIDKLTPDELALVKKGYRNFQWFAKRFAEAGGKFVVGPDTSSVYHATQIPGRATVREIQLLVDAGLTPMQAIQAATKNAAELLRSEDQLGTIEEGKLADLIIVTRNPLEDIKNMEGIEVVIKDGQRMPLGYHYDYKNPIPWPVGDELTYGDWGPVSEIPTRITSISPQVVGEGSGSFTLTVDGHEFVSSSVVRFGDRRLATEWVSSDQLKARVPGELVEGVGTYPVRVVHRAPGWGKTNTVYFIVKFK